jgi:hypothetical protein
MDKETQKLFLGWSLILAVTVGITLFVAKMIA